MYFIFFYIKQHRLGILAFFLFCMVFLAAFLLYRLPAGAVMYPALVCMLVGLVFLTFHFYKTYRKHRQLQALMRLPASLIETFPPVYTQDDADYQQLIRLLASAQKQLETQMRLQYSDMVDYYTNWAHQIKTPIASMRLTLQNEDSDLARRLSDDLFRIEQYVEMALVFVRLDSSSSDYVIREYKLDDVIRQAIRRFAGQFIRKKIRLVYTPVDVCVVTDEKWLLFVIEQVLSNALKYTPPSGTITINMEQPKTLCIRDTGIGIAPEDLPRIFEKGYTGYNGREDKKASGIGLYLCRKICKNLGHAIAANASLDNGTVIRIYLEQAKLEIE
ncbi:MAG TPA: sensor histidine kinase [Candidatus Scatavimonas merdigallinarum]|uniref:histidine kinase n=1 Tax=Candidatus Scatavimonas merdigallinarum TaxID=2840914 RepID=A0A9D0ZKH7_9FIRM|nr:sensor histidine kinase [Candidatus Scatavimonas merdigallinarum]